MMNVANRITGALLTTGVFLFFASIFVIVSEQAVRAETFGWSFFWGALMIVTIAPPLIIIPQVFAAWHLMFFGEDE